MPDTSILHKRLNGLLSENRIDKLFFEEVNVYQKNSRECVKTMHVLMLNYRAIAKGIYSNGFLIRDEVIFLSGILSSMAAFCFASELNDDHKAIVEAIEEILDKSITNENIDVFHKIYLKLNVPH